MWKRILLILCFCIMLWLFRGCLGCEEVPIPTPMDVSSIMSPPPLTAEQPSALLEKDKIHFLNYRKFDFPPPSYSDIETYNFRTADSNSDSLGQTNTILERILLSAGFVNEFDKPRFQYFQLKLDEWFIGYAIVTDFEKINKDGVPLEDRFDLEVNKRKSEGFWDYFLPKKLNKGHFRFFAFLITDNFYKNRVKLISKNEAVAKMELGHQELHPLIKQQPISDDCKLHILVYEYKQKEGDEDGIPKTKEYEILGVKESLKKAGFPKGFLTTKSISLDNDRQKLVNLVDSLHKNNILTFDDYEYLMKYSLILEKEKSADSIYNNIMMRLGVNI